VLADIVTILAAIALVALVAGWEFFCLRDLAQAERVRLLPRWAWAVACIIQIPFGGILYLLFGRVWRRQSPTDALS
jgi:Phospholipase_D-nuclease N-terminal